MLKTYGFAVDPKLDDDAYTTDDGRILVPGEDSMGTRYNAPLGIIRVTCHDAGPVEDPASRDSEITLSAEDAFHAPALRDALRAMVDAYGRIPPEELDHQQSAALAAAREALGGAK